MKDFFKMLLAVICGLIIMGVISALITFSVIGSLAATGSQASIPREGVLKIDMSGILLSEQSQEANPIESVKGAPVATIGILEAVQAINAAAEDPAVKYIYLKTDGSASDMAVTGEFRKALQNFRTISGKAIVSYIESPSTGSYWLASVSDKVYMTAHPGANVMMTGVGTQMVFIGDLLKEVGVDVQLIRHGKYKSAGEMFTRGSASPENLEQYQVMVNSLWAGIRADIASSRNISEQDLDAALDGLKLCLPEDFVNCNLVDELLTRTSLEQKLATLAMADSYKKVQFINFADYASLVPAPSKAHNKIAIIYANGEIMDGSDEKDVCGDRFAAIIEKVRADSTVKSVVLRVNSPGGSVIASEKIKHELDLLKECKPLIASYGAYAASGGYWISAACEKIFCDPQTLTGSIGVFGMVPNLGKVTRDKLHVNFQSVTSNSHGDMFSLMRPFDSDEHAYMQRSIEAIYERFTALVSEGRGIPQARVDEIGQGRVWTGSDALGIHLVDEIGTLEDAVKYAAVAAGNPDLNAWKIKGYPQPKTQLQVVMESLNGTQEDYSVLAKLGKELKTAKVVARLPYEISF